MVQVFIKFEVNVLQEREKRAKKKERKKTATEEAKSGSNEGDSTPNTETPIETVESETREIPKKISKRSPKPSQFTKQTRSKYTPPPPLRNRGKRRMQPWMWWALLAVIIVMGLCLVWNRGFPFKLVSESFHI